MSDQDDVWRGDALQSAANRLHEVAAMFLDDDHAGELRTDLLDEETYNRMTELAVELGERAQACPSGRLIGDVEVELVMNEYDYWWPEVHDTPPTDRDDEHSGHVYRTVPAWIARAWEEAYERSERARTALLTAAGVADNESVRDPDEPVQAPEPCACWTGAMVPGWTRASVILPYDGSPAGGYAVFTGHSEDEARAYLRSLPRRFVLHSRFTPGGSLRRARRKDLRIEVEGRDPWPGLCPTCLWPRDRHASWVLAPHLGGEA